MPTTALFQASHFKTDHWAWWPPVGTSGMVALIPLAFAGFGPFRLAEMNNPSAESVVQKVVAAPYANLMRAEFGADIFNNPTLAFQKLVKQSLPTKTIPASNHSRLNTMLSVQGKATLTANELRGMNLFMDTRRKLRFATA